LKHKSDGSINFVGWKDTQVKIRGQYIDDLAEPVNKYIPLPYRPKGMTPDGGRAFDGTTKSSHSPEREVVTGFSYGTQESLFGRRIACRGIGQVMSKANPRYKLLTELVVLGRRLRRSAVHLSEPHM